MNPQALIATIKINVLRRPLWQSETVQECLDISRDKLIQMIESGEIAWAWNIGQGQTRRELRVLGHCIVEAQTGPIAGIGNTRNLQLPEVLNLILPQSRKTFRGRELQSLFLCNPDTVRNLHLCGDLEKVPEKLANGGPNSSAHFTRESVVRLFQKRRVT